MLLKTDDAIQQIATTFTEEVGQFKTLINDLQNAMGKVIITPNGYISMPQKVQEKFVTIVADLAVSSEKTAQSIDELQTDITSIKNGLDKTVKSSGSYTNCLFYF